MLHRSTLFPAGTAFDVHRTEQVRHDKLPAINMTITGSALLERAMTSLVSPPPGCTMESSAVQPFYAPPFSRAISNACYSPLFVWLGFFGLG